MSRVTSCETFGGPAPRRRAAGRASPEGQAQDRRRHSDARRDQGHCGGRYRAAGGRFLLTAIFTGLRASELRGLRWDDVDLEKRELHVRQRADRYNAIGKPKSESGERTVPLTPIVLNTLREWKLACPKSEHGLVFPTGGGNVENHANIVERGLDPRRSPLV